MKSDSLLWLARELDDHTAGNHVIRLDWGNLAIECKAGVGDCCELKNLLSDLARDYLRLRKAESAV
jgi:hypothetical protein